MGLFGRGKRDKMDQDAQTTEAPLAGPPPADAPPPQDTAGALGVNGTAEEPVQDLEEPAEQGQEPVEQSQEPATASILQDGEGDETDLGDLGKIFEEEEVVVDPHMLSLLESVGEVDVEELSEELADLMAMLTESSA
jgi:hypothetical protein